MLLSVYNVSDGLGRAGRGSWRPTSFLLWVTNLKNQGLEGSIVGDTRPTTWPVPLAIETIHSPTWLIMDVGSGVGGETTTVVVKNHQQIIMTPSNSVVANTSLPEIKFCHWALNY